MSVTYEANGRLYLGAAARLISDVDRELAWAERLVRKDPDIKWILGNYVQADVPNDNGHIFPLTDLETAHLTVAGKPLNMLHHQNYIVGAYAGAEILRPDPATAGDQSAPGDHRKCKSCGAVMAKDATTCPSCGAKWSASAAALDLATPHVEALAGMWHRLFPEEYQLVKKAHADGSLFYSMECLPETVTCPSCNMTAAYAGPTSDTYCAHMNTPRGPKRLNKPVFGAGAIIIPPVKPGWRRADISQLDQLLQESTSEAVYAALEGEMPHLDPAQWESMMAWIQKLALL